MQKDGLLELAHEERGYTYGGREVLRVICDMPRGKCRAATHFERIMTLWASFAERELFPAAAREWEEKARGGMGFAFHPYTARGHIQINPAERGLKIEFSAILSAGGEVRLSHTLSTFWSITGEQQCKKAKRRLHF